MAFPIPDPNTSESAVSERDEDKRTNSPPSSFYAQSQAILNAVTYFEPLNSGYEASATKHKNRTRSALFVQLMASFEFTMKDFIAQILDATHIYDEKAKTWTWLQLDVPTVLSTREGQGRLGAVLIHPLLGWQVPETLNSRYKDVFQREPVASGEFQTLRDLWTIRHSVAHNGGFVTVGDARRLRALSLSERHVLIDEAHLQAAAGFLRGIVARLESVVGPAVLDRWCREAATGSWQDDEETYCRLKQITAYVQSRPKDVPTFDEATYQADRARYP